MKAKRTWLLLLYSFPARQAAARVNLWRQLRRAGAVPFKTGTCVLPDEPQHAERLQWIAQQARDGGGEATLVRASEFEGVPDDELARQFTAARATDYAALAREVSEWIGANRRKRSEEALEQLARLAARFEEIRAIDFFGAPQSENVRVMLERARALEKGPPADRPVLSRRAFTGRTWLTRPRPEIDRVGSAWLIRRFIDAKAKFIFDGDHSRHPGALAFDMTDVEFSHHGHDCTFETLIKRFAVDDVAVRKIGEMVHAADLDDGKFDRTECIGIDRVLKGWGRMGWSDEQLLLRGGECFDALYAFLSHKR